jgi:hypothetical protein
MPALRLFLTSSLVLGGFALPAWADAMAASGSRTFVTAGQGQGQTTGGLFGALAYTSPGSTGTTVSVNLAGPSSNDPPASSSSGFSSFQPAPVSGGSASGTSTGSSSTSSSAVDALINFSGGPYPEASTLTTGNAQPWYTSSAVTHAFGGTPSAGQQSAFEAEVLSTIQKTYNNAGLNISLTTNPNQPAAHVESVVSGTSYGPNNNAIGITDVGHDGFSFIDKFTAAQTPDQLAIAIGHNLAHELMHAFGLANHPEASGPYVDAASTTFANLSDPSIGFSSAAAQLLSSLNFQATGNSILAGGSGAQLIDGDQVLTNATPTPEPATLALWMVAGGLVVAHRRVRSGQAVASRHRRAG